MNTFKQAEFALDHLVGQGFIGRNQASFIRQLMKGEERQHFIDTIIQFKKRIDEMPKTGEQDGKRQKAIVFLHYFVGSADWYITEKDSDPDKEGQIQAFGHADLFGDGGELGYINLREVTKVAELDLYFKPQTLAEVLK